MSVTQLLGFARRVQRIREQQQTVARDAVCREHRCRAPAHRAPADDEYARTKRRTRVLDHRLHARLEARHRVRAAGAVLAIQEIEAHHADAALAQRRGKALHAAIAHVAARAVRAHEDDRIGRIGGRLENRARLVAVDYHAPVLDAHVRHVRHLRTARLRSAHGRMA